MKSATRTAVPDPRGGIIPRLLIRFRTAVACAMAAVALGAPAIALALTATTVTISASPSPATQGQPVTLSATPSVPGTVTFSYGGQVLGTGSAQGLAANAASPLRQPVVGAQDLVFGHLAADTTGNLALSMTSAHASKWITAAGSVSTFAGSVVGPIRAITVSDTGTIYEGTWSAATSKIYARSAPNAAPAVFTSSGLNNPCGMTTDAAGNLYVANQGAGNVVKITAAGAVSTYASGLVAPCGVALNRTTGVLYVGDYIDGTVRTRILAVPAGGGTPSTLAEAKCPQYGQLAIDDAGSIYGRACAGTASPTPWMGRIAPSGAMDAYMPSGTPLCCSGTTFPGQNTQTEVAVVGSTVYIGGRSLDDARIFGLGPTSLRATLSYTPPSPGSYAIQSSLAPTAGGTYAPSSGNGTLLVKPATPQAPDLAAASDTGASTTDDLTRDNTPTINVPGPLNHGDTYTVTAVSGIFQAQCTFVAAVNVTGCDLTTLTDGTWSITVTDTASPGGISAASSALSVTVDTTVPSAPAGVDLVAASDTGSSSTDNVTGVTTPTMGAVGGATGDTMRITASRVGSPDVMCTYLPTGQSTCVMPVMADGTWSVTATLIDAAGNVSSASSPLSVRIVSTAGAAPATPDLATASDTGSSSTDDLTRARTPVITVAGVTNGDVVTVKASLAGQADVICTFTASGATTGCQLGTLVDGTWSIVSRAVDPVGNTSPWSTSLSVAIDGTAPSTPQAPDLAAASDTGASTTDDLTRDNTPTINVPGPLNHGDTYTVTAVSGIFQAQCTFVAAVNVTGCDLTTLTDGTWSITVADTDPAANQSPASSPLSIVVNTITPSAPGLPDLVAASDTGSSATDNLTGDSTPGISIPGVNAGDRVVVTATSGGTSVSCAYTQGLATSCDLPPLPDGTWIITATATDPAGNTSTASGALSLDVDTVGPAGPGAPSMAPASDSGSSNSDGVTRDTTPEIIVPGSTHGEVITVVATDAHGNTLQCTFVASAQVQSCTLPMLAPGDWTVRSSSNAVDAAGNAAPASAPAHITIDTANPAPGVPDLAPASDTGPSDRDDVTKDATPAIDVPGVKPGSTVTVTARQPGQPDATCTFVASDVVTGCTLPFLSDGAWSISASSIDPAGNHSPASAPLSVFMDTAPPSPPPTPSVPGRPTTTPLGPVQDLGGDDRPLIGVDGGTPGDTIIVMATDGTRTITCSFVVGQASSCRLPALPSGTWTITATATDPAGNMSRSSGSITARVASPSRALTRRPVLALTVTSSRRTLRPRDRAVITLRARNTGKAPARNIVLRVAIPSGLAVIGQRALAVGSSGLRFTVPSLAPGTSVTRHVTVVALSSAVGRAATVTGRLSAAGTTSRSASASHRVVAPAKPADTAPVTG